MSVPPHPKQHRGERSLYDVLRVRPNASPAELQRQYRRLALELHPDRNPGREDEVKASFQTVTEAYSTLSDTVKREAYDARANVNFASRVDQLARRAQTAAEAPRPSQSPQRAPGNEPSKDVAGDDDDDGDDEDDDEYVPGYAGASKGASAEVTIEPCTVPLQVVFTVTRPTAAAPLGLMLEQTTMLVRGAGEGSAAEAARIPAGARVTHACGVAVATPQELAAAAKGRTDVALTVVADGQWVTVPRGSIAEVGDGGKLASVIEHPPGAKTFASPTTAQVRLRAAAGGAASLALGEGQQTAMALTDLPGAWSALRGRRVLLVGAAVPEASGDAAYVLQAESAAAALGSTRAVADGDGAVTPAELAMRRQTVRFLVLADDASCVGPSVA